MSITEFLEYNISSCINSILMLKEKQTRVLANPCTLVSMSLVNVCMSGWPSCISIKPKAVTGVSKVDEDCQMLKSILDHWLIIAESENHGHGKY